MSHYRQKPKYVEKGTAPKYIQKGSEKQPNPHSKTTWVQKKPQNTRYRQKDIGDYDYDPSTITEQTPVPKLPAKQNLLTLPKQSDWEQQESSLLDEIQALKDKRRQIHNSKFVREKQVRTTDEDGNVFGQYDVEHDELIKLKDLKTALLKEIKPRKEEIQHLTQELDGIHQELKMYEGEGRRSKEALEQRLEELQEYRVKGVLNPKQEKAVNLEIEGIKKDLGSAVSYENIEIRRVFLHERKGQLLKQRDLLFKEKKPFSDQFDIVNQQFNEKNERVKALIDQFEKANKNKSLFKEEIEKEKEDFYNSKFEKKKDIDNQIDSIYDRIDQIWDDYHKKVDEYKKQQQYIEYSHWVARQKEHLAEKKKKAEERKLWEEREKKRKERELEWEKNKPKKYTPQIRDCEFLIQYCEKLKPKFSYKPTQKQPEKPTPEQIEKILADDQQWKKEKGVALIQPKKTREEDVEIKPKKVLRHEIEAEKEKEKEKEVANYVHDFSVVALFEGVNTLPPDNDKDIERVIGELRERSEYYRKMNEDEKEYVNPLVEAKQQYRARNEEEEKQNRNEKNERNERKHKKEAKFQPKAEDFPAL